MAVGGTNFFSFTFLCLPNKDNNNSQQKQRKKNYETNLNFRNSNWIKSGNNNSVLGYNDF